jgi:hypothetical protein
VTPVREAIILPVIFLTVTLFGGFRLADQVRFVPPSLTALVLALLLMGTMTRGGVIVPQLFMHGGRQALDNLSGAVVLLTAFAASAQAINVVLPERGLLHGAFAVLFFCQVMTMNAAGATRTGLLRSLLVLLGSLFVLRYIVIESLYAPGGGLLTRMLTALMAGATLGGIEYQPHAQATGYVAFGALVLYVSGIVLMRPDGTATALVPWTHPAERLPARAGPSPLP